MRSRRAQRWLASGLLAFAVACGGGGAPAAQPPAPLACQQNDGRCVVCAWMDQGAPRCRITIFPGACPAGAEVDRGACPAGPVASCDRSSPGYFAGTLGYADADFYYGPQDLAQAEAACAQSGAGPTGSAPLWTVYP